MELGIGDICQSVIIAPSTVTPELHDMLIKSLPGSPLTLDQLERSHLPVVDFSISFYEDALESLARGVPVKSKKRERAEDNHPVNENRRLAEQLGVQLPKDLAEGPAIEQLAQVEKAMERIAKGQRVEDPILPDGYLITLTKEVAEMRLGHFRAVRKGLLFLFRGFPK